MSLLLLFFVWGLVWGSFLNVIIIRGHRGESLRGRSRCESCLKELSWKELVPVLSFIIQKGRCRNCGSVLSLQYLLVELGTAILFVAAGWKVISLPENQFWMLILLFLRIFAAISASIVILVSDIRWQIIPNGAVLTLILVATASISIFRKPLSFGVLYDIGAALVLAMFLGGLWFVSGGRWIGFGDVKLIFATSLLVGYPASFAAFIFSFWLGGAAGIVFLALGKKSLGSRIPFGPYILAGSALAFFYAEKFFEFLLLT